jgi:hypothetical protein
MTDSLKTKDRVRYVGNNGLFNLSYGATGTVDGFTQNGFALVRFDRENFQRRCALVNLETLEQGA